MTQKTLSNVTIGDRLISLNNQVILHVVSSHEGNPVLIEDQGEGETGQVFETLGAIIPLNKLSEDGFLKIFEIAPYVNDTIVALVDGKFVTGSVLIVSDHLVTFAPTASLTDRPRDGVKAHLVNREDVYVIYPVPRIDDPLLEDDDIVVVINPLNARFGSICGVVDAPVGGGVSVEFLDGSIKPLRVFEVAKYTREAQVTVLSAEAVENPSDLDDAPSASPEAVQYFGVDFTPANVSDPQEDGEDYNPIGDCFSMAELEIIYRMSNIDHELAANMLGYVVKSGRKIDDAILRAVLGEGIPYGFSQFIPDATAYFTLVGNIAEDQAKGKLDALASGTDQHFASPSSIAFAHVSGFDQDEAEAVMSNDLNDADIHDLADAYAQRAAEGYKSEPDAAAAGFGSTTDVLDEVFGKGKYRLLSAEEAVKVFGDDAISAIAEGGVFGEMIDDDDLSLNAGDDDFSIEAILKQMMGDLSEQSVDEDAPSQKEHIDIDECLAEFSTLAQAGRTDSLILSKQINEQVDKHRDLVEMVVADLTSAINGLSNYDVAMLAEGLRGVSAGLKLLVVTNAETESLAGNAKMISDAFDALVTDITNLEQSRFL